MKSVLRRLALLMIIVVFVLIAAVIAYGNQTPIDIDIGFMLVEGVSLTVALAITFALGTLFGALFGAIAMVRHVRERHLLRRELRRTEAELQSLRSLPGQDAG